MNVNYSIADIKKSSYHDLINEGKANDFLKSFMENWPSKDYNVWCNKKDTKQSSV